MWTDPPPANDPRALQDPFGGPSAPRSIGVSYNSMTTAIDVELQAAAEGQVSFSLAVYLVDYDAGRPDHDGLPPRQATVALLDRWTLDPAAPVQYLDSFVNGTWLVFAYNRSCRIRVSQLEGDNAVVSAVALSALRGR